MQTIYAFATTLAISLSRPLVQDLMPTLIRWFVFRRAPPQWTILFLQCHWNMVLKKMRPRLLLRKENKSYWGFPKGTMAPAWYQTILQNILSSPTVLSCRPYLPTSIEIIIYIDQCKMSILRSVWYAKWEDTMMIHHRTHWWQVEKTNTAHDDKYTSSSMDKPTTSRSAKNIKNRQKRANLTSKHVLKLNFGPNLSLLEKHWRMKMWWKYCHV